MTEAALTLKIKNSLNKLPCSFFIKIHGGQYQRGVSDLVGVYRSQAVHLEVKLPGKEKTLTELQQKHLTNVQEAGGYAYMVTSVKQATDVLKTIDGILDYE